MPAVKKKSVDESDTLNFKKFVGLIREGKVNELNHVIGDSYPFIDETEDAVTIIHCKRNQANDIDSNTSEALIMKVFSLPKGLQWPTFFDVKQMTAQCPNVYLERCASHCHGRDNKTWQLLSQGLTCAWIGLPGIGKTTAINGLLMRSIQSLGAAEGFDRVIARIDRSIFDVQIDQGNLHVFPTEVSCLKEAEDYMYKAFRKNGGLQRKLKIAAFLELQEGEADPKCYLPTLVTSSSRDVFSKTLKTVKKIGYDFLVVDPWSKEEIQAMVETLCVFGGESVGFLRGCWDDRFASVGGIPCVVTAAETRYQDYLQDMDEAASSFSSSLNDLTIGNIPSSAKYFVAVAPFVAPGTEIPMRGKIRNPPANIREGDTTNQSIIVFKFLSDKAKILVSKAVKNPQELEALKRFGFQYQIAEAIVLYGGLLTNSALDYELPYYQQLKEWEWYEDTGIGRPALRGQLPTKLIQSESNADILNLPLTRFVGSFEGQSLPRRLKRLREDTVYRSAVHNGAVFDHMLVSHESKRVFLVQVTDKDPIRHPFSLTAIHKIFQDLGLYDLSKAS